MKNLYKIAAFAIFGLFFFINIYTLNDGHNWGDDFAQYIQHAINLVEHKPYTSGISHDFWIVYPPGFPLLLSSMIYWFGINFKVLKFLNVLLWALSALAAYGLALMWLDLFWAGTITVWFLTSPFFFFFKQNVLSDIPFMCFVLLSIWTFMKSEEYQLKGLSDASRIFLLLSIFCMSYSILVRWAGISLFLAVILYFFVIRRDWKRSLGFILGAVISLFIALQCGSSAGGYFDGTTVSLLQNGLWASWYNLTYTFQIILNFFILNGNFLSKIITPATFPLINTLIGLLFLGIIGSFFYRLYQRKVSFMVCFTFFYLMGIVLWPVHAGARFFLPMMVPITIYLIKWIKPAWRKLAMFIFFILIFQNVFVIASNFKFNDDDIYQKDSLEMLQWVKFHIKPEENYMFSKPRALGMLTHRIGYTFGTPQKNTKDWYKNIEPLHINYLIADKRFDSFSQYNNFSLRVDNYDLYINVIWQNNLYKIYNVVLPANSGPIPAHWGRQ
jgi:hypothetical protein